MYSECHKTLEELYDIKGVYFLRLPYITLKYVLLLTSVIIKTLTIPLTFFFSSNNRTTYQKMDDTDGCDGKEGTEERWRQMLS